MLDRILEHKRAEIAHLNLAELKAQAAEALTPRDFLAAPRFASSPTPLSWAESPREGNGAAPKEPGRGVRLIAELKRASPSRGLLAPHVDLIRLARIYTANGAAAISVLTDEKLFLGRLDTLRALRLTHHISLPLLRKDFILSPAQIYETRAAGADAVLLIAAALPDDAELADLHALALDLGLTPLMEVHTLSELERILRLPRLKLVGVNNRDLTTFNVSLETTAQLRPHVPAGIGVVSESGIFTAEHIARLAALGVNAALVGEALVTAADIGAKVRELALGLQARPSASLPTR